MVIKVSTAHSVPGEKTNSGFLRREAWVSRWLWLRPGHCCWPHAGHGRRESHSVSRADFQGNPCYGMTCPISTSFGEEGRCGFVQAGGPGGSGSFSWAARFLWVISCRWLTYTWTVAINMHVGKHSPRQRNNLSAASRDSRGHICFKALNAESPPQVGLGTHAACRGAGGTAGH